MRKFFLLFVALAVGCVPILAQQYNNWYFGRQAGLDFNSNGTQPVPRVVFSSQMISNENASSISDESGNLLFYTNGQTIYNKLHQVMLNGDDIGGNVSACQSIIIQQPGSDSLFYVFVTDAVENDFQHGYRYSIVNMRRDGGNGEVVQKDQLLSSSCTERLTAVRHANGTDVWVITNDFSSNVFRSWLVTCTGLQPNPVVSTVGDVLNMHATTNTGVLKASPDGKLLCQTHFPFFDENLRLPNFAQLFDFNNASGVISNTRKIGFPSTQYTHCSFSPDSKLLYITRPYDKSIDQFEATLATELAIKVSRVSLPTTFGFYDIQIAPDEKVYVAQPSRYLSVINQPNVKGPGCNLVEQQIDLVTGTTFIGLPSFLNDVGAFDPANGFTYTILDSCSGRVQFNGFANNMPGTLSWSWDFGDGNTSTQQNPLHVFNPATAAYTVKLKITSSSSCAYIFRSRIIKPSGVVTKVDFDIIEKCDSGYIRFVNTSNDPQASGGQFIWDFGDGTTSTDLNPIHTYAGAGVYPVKLKLVTSTACLNDSMTKTVDLRVFNITTSPDQTIMVGQSVQISASGGQSYVWSPATGLNNPNSPTPIAAPLDDITYKVIGTDNAGCKAEDSVKITVIQLDDFYVPTAFTPNGDGKNDLLRPYYPSKYVLDHFSIYTRWGQRIFDTRERGKGWDGKINSIIQNAGVYVWQVQATERSSGKRVIRSGTFTLIR